MSPETSAVAQLTAAAAELATAGRWADLVALAETAAMRADIQGWDGELRGAVDMLIALANGAVSNGAAPAPVAAAGPGVGAGGLRLRDGGSVRQRALIQMRSSGPCQPRELAEALDVDKYQVSRALRSLATEGLVELTDAPAGADRRARYYRAV